MTIISLASLFARRALLSAVAVFALASTSGALAQCPINFATQANYPANSGPFSVAVGDLNGDGRMDVVVGYTGGGVVSVYLNVGGGVLGAKSDFNVSSGQVYSIVLARINNDPFLD